MRSVKAVNNTIYTGFYMDFGYWEKDEFGNLNYTSTVDVYGFQFNHDGCALSASGGDAAASGFTVSADATLSKREPGEGTPSVNGTGLKEEVNKDDV